MAAHVGPKKVHRYSPEFRMEAVKLARGEAGSVSIFPAIPILPLAAWGLAYAFHSLALPAGATVPGVVHGTFLVGLLVGIGKSALGLRSTRKV